MRQSRKRISTRPGRAPLSPDGGRARAQATTRTVKYHKIRGQVRQDSRSNVTRFAVKCRKILHAAGLEPRDELKRRIDEAARYVPMDQLGLSPQCGFASIYQGNPIGEADEMAKLRLGVDTARDVWGDD